ncbi:hypothetical protein [Cellulomonas sp. URHB0016]
MSVVEHPGPLLPGGPRLVLDVPDGWHVAPAPRAIAVARPATDLPGFVPNLTVAADLVPAGTTPVQVLDAMLAQYPGTRGHADGTAGSVLLTREHGSGPVRQRVDVLVDPTPLPGGHQHAVTVVSSWSDTTPAALRDSLAEAHTSVRLGSADPVPA